DATNERYTRNWDTKSPTRLDPTKFYRILVRGAPRGTPLGFFDVDPVDQGLKNLRTGEVVQFQNGRTLPIKVRIEDGAFGSTNPDHVERVVGNVATTVTTNTGFSGASFPDNWLPQGALDAGINQVVLIIERIPVGPGTNDPTCLQSGLMEREGCYRFRTDPDLHDFGPFSQLVTAGVCFEAPDLIGNANGPPLELHRRQLRPRRHHGHPGPGRVPDADPSWCLQPTRERAGDFHRHDGRGNRRRPSSGDGEHRPGERVRARVMGPWSNTGTEHADRRRPRERESVDLHGHRDRQLRKTALRRQHFRQ